MFVKKIPRILCLEAYATANIGIIDWQLMRQTCFPVLWACTVAERQAGEILGSCRPQLSVKAMLSSKDMGKEVGGRGERGREGERWRRGRGTG